MIIIFLNNLFIIYVIFKILICSGQDIFLFMIPLGETFLQYSCIGLFLSEGTAVI